MAVQDKRAQIVLKLFASGNRHVGGFEFGSNLLEPGGPEAIPGTLGVREIPRFGKAGEPRSERRRLRQSARTLTESQDIRTTSTLRMQPSTGTKGRKEIAEEHIVVEHPMHRGGAEDSVEGIAERKSGHVRSHELRAFAESRRQAILGVGRHVA